ncbi:MAG: DNA/RNA non-specific endonuclease, partial [Bacteroidales bacterium]|nr:DNA/RNA non-specific endonuclease [Bacteroidales bacterium]
CTETVLDQYVSDKAALEVVSKELPAEAGNAFVSVRTDGVWMLEITEGSEWASVSQTNGTGPKNNVVLTYAANPGKMTRTLRLVLSTGRATAELALTQAGGGQVVPGGGQGTATAMPRWLELPATSATDGLDFFSRTCTLGGKTLRNYAFYFDYTNRLSHWVAYPLCSVYLGGSGRSEAWGYDPFLPAAKQQNLSAGYKQGDNGWYDRGHQLPSADRTADDSVNATTFYGTNIIPQKNDFNAGVWATLEGRVRAWAKSSDTLYVVTGCVTDGATHYVLDRSNVRITVPTAYFKAVLRYSKNTTLGRAGYMAAAFWYDHDQIPTTFSKTQSLSVADLEEKLGYQLFVNLSDVVGPTAAETIKSEKPSTVNWWWQ